MGTRKDGVSMSDPFEGFSPPTKNYFHMPNEWTNITADIDSLAELKVIEYVLRHTWGFHEFGKPKPITVDEFMHGRKDKDGHRIDKGTGLKSDRSVKDGIKAAIEDGFLVCEIDDTDKARIKKAYALKMLSSDETRGVDSTPHQTGRIYPSGGQNLPLDQVDSTPRSEKDTLERHFRKKSNLPIGKLAPAVAEPPATLFLSESQPEQLSTPTVEKPTPLVEKEKPSSSKSRTPREKVPKPAEPELSEEARRIWDIWLDMPWNKGITPRLTETAARHCETLSKIEMSADIMFKVLNFAQKNDRNGFYKGKSRELGHVVAEYPRWKSAQYQSPEPQVSPQKMTVGSRAARRFS
jgi:hypothetical protein